jgi:hypothetical protein
MLINVARLHSDELVGQWSPPGEGFVEQVLLERAQPLGVDALPEALASSSAMSVCCGSS